MELRIAVPDRPNLNLENFLEFSPLQFDLISHTLTLGYAAHFAAILYFAFTLSRAAPPYRGATIMSIAVTTSAALLLLRLSTGFENAFVFDGTSYVPTGEKPFSHGFRYLNWLIDVPLLLCQLLFAVTLTARRTLSLRIRLAITGALMVVLGYIGQFYEATDLTLLLVWGALSTVPYVYFSVLIWRVIGEGMRERPGPVATTLRNLRLLFLFSWGLYPIAYLVPAVQLALGDITAEGAVVRTVLFTLADITSKIVAGVLLGKVLQVRSAEESYAEAAEAWPQATPPLTGHHLEDGYLVQDDGIAVGRQ